MSSEEPALLSSRSIMVSPTAAASSPNNPAAPTFSLNQRFRLVYDAVGDAIVYRPVDTSLPLYPSPHPGSIIFNNFANVNLGEQNRKKELPRDYSSNGLAPALSPALQAASFSPPWQEFDTSATQAAAAPPLFASPPFSQMASGGSAMPNSARKARGRPPGSSKKQKRSSPGSTAVGFTTNVIEVKPGDDVYSKIMGFSQKCSRAISIISASGAISSATVRQAASSGGTVNYEGQFYILSLSGSFKLLEVGNQKCRTGGLSIMLSGCDGRVLGGFVAGPLIAASPVQIIITSFKAYDFEGKKSASSMEPSFAPQVRSGGATGASSSTSNVAFDEFFCGPENSQAGNEYTPKGMSGLAGN